MDELDYVLTIEVLSSAINHLSSDKTPENDYIPPYLIEICKSALLLPLHDIYCQCWQEVEILQDMRDALNNHSV